MTDRLADITGRIRDVQQLETVVGAMRAIAAAHAQQSRSRLVAIRAYAAVVAEAIARALRLLPDEDARARGARGGNAPGGNARADCTGLILFTAEQGFAGAFSDRMLEAARPKLPGAAVFLIGSRGGMLADERHIQTEWRTRMALRADAAAAVAERICTALYAHLSEVPLTRVDLMFPTWVHGTGLVPCLRSLLPLDRHVFSSPLAGDAPLITLSPAALLERLAEEYVYAQLCEAATEAFVAENEARVASMATAKTNIEENLDGLRMRERLVRQEEITAEVVELATGSREVC